ncbi:MAG TPA: hypothetical protein PLT57_12195, partial [Accumulibacter sp.]|nr:hypothetical protein [Accumulibacter sp.]
MNIHSAGSTPPAQVNPVVGNLVREISRPKAEESTVPVNDPTLSATATGREQPVDRQQLEAATKVVREFVQPINNNLEFSVD